MTDTREHKIRALLRWYPKRWRLVNEEVIVSDLLDSLDASTHPRLPITERLALMSNGIMHRFAQALPAELRARVALNTFAVGLSFAMVYIGLHVWAPWAPAPYGYVSSATLFGVFNEYGLFANPGVGYVLTWGIAGIGALRDRPFIIRIGLWSTIALSVAAAALVSTPWITWIGPTIETTVFMLVSAACGLSGQLGAPQRVVTRTAIMLAAWIWLYTFFIYYPTAEFVSDAWIWRYALSPANLITALLAVGLLCIALMVMKRRHHSATLALSTLPWIAVVGYTAPTALIIGGIIAVIVGFAATGIVIAARQSGYTVTKTVAQSEVSDAPLPLWVWAIGLGLTAAFVVWRLMFWFVESSNCIAQGFVLNFGVGAQCMVDGGTAELGQIIGWGLAIPATVYLAWGLVRSIRSRGTRANQVAAA